MALLPRQAQRRAFGAEGNNSAAAFIVIGTVHHHVVSSAAGTPTAGAKIHICAWDVASATLFGETVSGLDGK
jgi:hypothetical protein